MGIVHHSKFIVYFEEGRSDYARQRGYPYSTIEDSGHYLTVTEIGVRYARPAHYEQLICVQTWVTEVQSRALTFNYEIVDAGTREVLVTGFSRHICITHDGKVAHIPDKCREWGSG
jgi:acyl-CoA thioester hydrolase